MRLFPRLPALRLLVMTTALIIARPLQASEVRVAVASNFLATAKALAAAFERHATHQVILSPGATGRHFAQIVHGAPFDVFLAADAKRPRRLEETGLAIKGSRFTYAVGRLVLWSPRPGFVDRQGKVLATGRFAHLALANPRLAPYGRAARETLLCLGLWKSLQPRLVQGENAAQAFHFVTSGAAQLGFAALAQIVSLKAGDKGSFWMVPRHCHGPILQQAVVLRDTAAAQAFAAFLRSQAARAIIEAQGYELP